MHGYLASTCVAAFRCNETRAGPVVWSRWPFKALQQRSSSEFRYIFYFFLHVLTSPFSQKTATQLSCNCQVTKTTVPSTHPSALKSRLYPMMTMTTLGAEELTEKNKQTKKKSNHTREGVGLESISMWDAHLNPRTHVVSALFFFSCPICFG